MGHQIVDDETHVLSNCDLYSTLRSKLITTLNKSPHSENIENYQQLNVTQESQKDHLMNLLSPHFNSQEPTESEININQFKQLHSEHNLRIHTPEYVSLLHIRASVCTFIFRCLDKRWKYHKEVREAEAFRSIVIFLDD